MISILYIYIYYNFYSISGGQSKNISTRNSPWTKDLEHSLCWIYHWESSKRCVRWVASLCAISLYKYRRITALCINMTKPTAKYPKWHIYIHIFSTRNVLEDEWNSSLENTFSNKIVILVGKEGLLQQKLCILSLKNALSNKIVNLIIKRLLATKH